MAHPTIERIRRVRREIAAEHDYDPEKLGAYFRKLDREGRKKAEERAGDSEVLGLGRQKKKEGGG